MKQWEVMLYLPTVGDLLKQGLNKENSRRLQIILQLKYDLNKLLPGLEASVAAGYYNTLIETSPKLALMHVMHCRKQELMLTICPFMLTLPLELIRH